MSTKPRLIDIFEGKYYQKIVLTVGIVVMLVLELLIYMAAAGHSGQKSRVIITDSNGEKVFESPGNTLTSYERLTFENTFGPLDNYRLHIQTDVLPFPFRAWLTAAIGVPIGLVLLMAFLVRAYLSLLYGEEESDLKETLSGTDRLRSTFQFFHRISVFHIGFLAVLAVLLIWMVPNFLGDFFKISMATVHEFKWFFLGVAIFLGFLVMWVIYLRYNLSKKMLENQFDLEKFRVERQLPPKEEVPLLADVVKEAQEPLTGQDQKGMGYDA